MSEPVTLEDIYQLFRASAEEYDRRAAESKAEYDRHRVEIENLLAESKLESDRSMAELKRTVCTTLLVEPGGQLTDVNLVPVCS